MNFFDLHCDTFTSCADSSKAPFGDDMQLSFDKRSGIERWCELLAIFIADDKRGDRAFAEYQRYRDYIKAFAEEHSDILALCKTNEDIESALAEGKCAGILAIESSAALGGRLENIYKLAEDGVKSMTLTWNGENEFACGCGAGGHLKSAGKELVDAMNELAIAIDVSHLSDDGLDDLLGYTEKPVIATHSNIRAMCAHPRNLTNEHFREIARRGGVVGLNLCVGFIKNDCAPALSDFLNHAYQMLSLGGERCLCMGSDFDGADMPEFCRDLGDIPSLYETFKKEFGETAAMRVFYDNARGYFSRLMG